MYLDKLKYVLLGLSIFCLAGLCWISCFNVYQTDDYIYAAQSRDLGLFVYMKELYFTWGGRYFSYSVNALSPVIFDSYTMLPKVFPIVYFVLFLLGCYLNFRIYFKEKLNVALFNSLLFFLFYTLCLGSISEHYFWFSGANVYFLSHILLLFFLFFWQKKSLSSFHKAVIVLLIMILMGTNEVVALFLLMFLGAAFLSYKTKEHFFYLLVGFLFFLFLFAAPGNYKRLDTGAHLFIEMMAKKFAIMVYNFGYVVVKVGFIVPLFLLVFRSHLEIVNSKLSLFLLKYAVTCWLLLIVFLGFMSLILPSRSGELVMILSLLMCSLLLMKFSNFQIEKLWWIGLVIFLPKLNFFSYRSSTFFLNYNLESIIEEAFVTDLSQYQSQMIERHHLLESFEKTELMLPRIQTIPKVLYFEEMGTKDQPNYINNQLEKFYKKEAVFVEERK